MNFQTKRIKREALVLKQQISSYSINSNLGTQLRKQIKEESLVELSALTTKYLIGRRNPGKKTVRT